jgi:AraC family transcriptional regulator of adaptative response/methylated-DNA-[protein]-cysteine methyltransferase
MNEQHSQQATDYQRIEQAIRYLETHFREQPSLDDIAASVHLSKYHFQRLFKRWAGVSPTQFMHYLTVEYAKERLAEAQSVFETSLDSGLSGAGRLHDLFVNFEAMTPGQYKNQAAGLDISYGFQDTPFGQCLLAETQRGICALRFMDEEGSEQALAELRQEWPQAIFCEDPERTRETAGRIFSLKTDNQPDWPFNLLLKGTNFQIQVWRALLSIPSGAMVSYGDVAGRIDKPKASRAVGLAVARNPVGYFIPCHRVINQSGRIHNYRWGATRKKAILGWEASQI